MALGYMLLSRLFRHVGLIYMLPPPLHANVEYLPQPVVVVEVIDATNATTCISTTYSTYSTLKWNGTQS